MRLVRADKPTSRLRGKAKAVSAIVIAATLALLGWAWFDGGQRPLREIVQPVPVPEQAR